MLITITNTAEDATDLGYLLHKHPAKLHSIELPFGTAHVFYSSATPKCCTASLLLELDPVELVRGAQQLEDYVNDRPYVASSYFTVALARVFGTALAGNCTKRPELVNQKLPLQISVEVIRSLAGADIFQRLLAPLGYRVETSPIALDNTFPDWGPSFYYRLVLDASITLHDALSHLYVLMPVFDEQKHYYVGDAEVDKLIRHGAGWLAQHPERDFIVKRYLRRSPTLIDQALARLLDEEGAAVEEQQTTTRLAALNEQDLERPLTLHTQRLIQVANRLKSLGAKSVVDLGCGEGKLLRRLLADRTFDQIIGMDVSHRSLEIASARLRLATMPERQRQRIQLLQGSLLYRDKRLSGFDAAALVEVIEHLDTPRLAALQRVLFEFARPRHIILTTPNREYNALFPTLPAGKMRHADHRFEWSRPELTEWATTTAARFGYEVTFEHIGPVDIQYGAPSQMAVFSLLTGAVQ